MTAVRTRIAVAGAGLIGREHVARLRESPSCALCAVVDPSPAARALAEAAAVPLHASLDDLFASDPPDGAGSTPPSRVAAGRHAGPPVA